MLAGRWTKLCFILALSLSILVNLSVHLVSGADQVGTPRDESNEVDATLSGQSRAGNFLKGMQSRPALRPKQRFVRPMTQARPVRPAGPLRPANLRRPARPVMAAPRIQHWAPPPSPAVTIMNPSPIKQTSVVSKKYSREQLEAALEIPGVRCGTVPMYEKLHHKSINEALTKEEEKDDEANFRIINGIDSRPGEWPWIVRLMECPHSGRGNCFTCTGTLLNNRWVISAGHCGYNRSAGMIYKATMGLYDLVSPDRGSFSINVDRIIVHPDYQNLNNDLALFRLATPVQFSDQVQPACLIRATRNALQYTQTKRCYAVGYGLTAGMVAAVKLQKLRINPKAASECNSDQLNAVQLRANTICIGVPRGHTGASCNGDSGGPDICYNAKQNHWELFATVSYGPTNCDRAQGDRWLTVSVDVSNFRTWILSTILDNS